MLDHYTVYVSNTVTAESILMAFRRKFKGACHNLYKHFPVDGHLYCYRIFTIKLNPKKPLSTDNRPVVAKGWVMREEGLMAEGHEGTFCSIFTAATVKL